MEHDGDDFEIRLSGGEGCPLTPENVDAFAALEFAAAYLGLVRRVSELRGAPVNMEGLQVREGSVRFVSHPSSAAAAQEAVGETGEVLAGRSDLEGVAHLANRVRMAAARLPRGHVAEVVLGPWSRKIAVATPEPPRHHLTHLSIRAVLMRVGGVRPRARFRSELEDANFTLDVGEDLAREIGAHIYREVDIEAFVRRDHDGRILDGRLEDFFPVDDSLGDWRKWFEVNASEWNEIDDIEAELRRD